MKIAYISADPDVPVFGSLGSSVHVQEVLIAMLKQGAEVHLFTSRIGDDPPTAVSALRLHSLPELSKADPDAYERAALAANGELREALAAEWEQGAFDFIYERQSLWSFAGMEFAREKTVPSVLEVNAPLMEEQVEQRTLLHRAAAEEAVMRTFRSANVITAVSRQLAHILEQHPSALGKIQVVPNAVNSARFVSASPAFVKAGAFVVGFVGMLKARHGLTSLIESFTIIAQQSTKAFLLVVGSGSEREYLEREIAARGLGSRVHFTGSVAPEFVPAYLASMDLALAPYPPLTQFYSSPLKVFEYMAAGLPIVASRIGQVGELIRHGETGLLVAPGNPIAMAQAVFELELDPERRARLGNAAREAVQEQTWDRVIERVFSFAGMAAAASASPAL
jgi:glycosyltransferase involved in cell wall biosynthesis